MNINFFDNAPGFRREYFCLFVLILLVYIPGLFVPLMDNDSAHHANIALNMHLTGNYAFLIDHGKPYLDKPHLLFWLAAFGYKVFGVTTFAYKLPTFLFTILGTYSTYRLGSLLYNKEAGRLAALIVSTACAYIIANTDVRMDAILSASIIFATWQLIEYIKGKKALNLVLSALGLALGFATKGMIGAVVPAMAVFFYLLYERNWKMIFHWKWLVLVLFFFIFISPVLYSYYLQFDLHPEVVVRGKANISGVKFILWNQNFERMQGESFTKNTNNDYFFFYHTFLWAFLPWSLLTVIAVISRLKTFISLRFSYRKSLEFLTLGSLILFVNLFSISKFKLPHYLNVLFPLFAILLAGYLYDRRGDLKRFRLFWKLQIFVVAVSVLLACLLLFWVFPVNGPVIMILSALLFIALIAILFKKSLALQSRVILFTLLGSAFTFFTFNANFYPQLLRYQAGNELALAAKKNNIPTNRIFTFQLSDVSFSFDFYTSYIHKNISLEAIRAAKSNNQEFWVLTDESGKVYLQDNKVAFQGVVSSKDFRVTRLKGGFLNPNTRPEYVSRLYLIRL